MNSILKNILCLNCKQYPEQITFNCYNCSCNRISSYNVSIKNIITKDIRAQFNIKNNIYVFRSGSVDIAKFNENTNLHIYHNMIKLNFKVIIKDLFENNIYNTIDRLNKFISIL